MPPVLVVVELAAEAQPGEVVLRVAAMAAEPPVAAAQGRPGVRQMEQLRPRVQAARERPAELPMALPRQLEAARPGRLGVMPMEHQPLPAVRRPAQQVEVPTRDQARVAHPELAIRPSLAAVAGVQPPTQAPQVWDHLAHRVDPVAVRLHLDLAFKTMAQAFKTTGPAFKVTELGAVQRPGQAGGAPPARPRVSLLSPASVALSRA